MKIVESVSWRDTFSTNPIFLKLWKVSLQETPSVWLSLLPKIKFFLWLVITDVLPTCEFLIVRRMKITNMCHFLNQNSENIDHIFKYCPFVQEIWDHIKYNCPTSLLSLLYEGDFLSWLEMVYPNYKINHKNFNYPMENLLLSCEMYGFIELRYLLGRSKSTLSSLLRKLS